MQITGPSSSVPGAFNLSDSGISLTQGGVTIFQAEMTNDLLIPDPLRPGYAQVQGSMTFLEEGEQPGMSQYIDQYFRDSSASDLFFETSILSQTNGLTQDGTAYGNADIESVAPVPEPVTALLILPAGLLAPRCRRRQVHTR